MQMLNVNDQTTGQIVTLALGQTNLGHVVGVHFHRRRVTRFEMLFSGHGQSRGKQSMCVLPLDDTVFQLMDDLGFVRQGQKNTFLQCVLGVPAHTVGQFGTRTAVGKGVRCVDVRFCKYNSEAVRHHDVLHTQLLYRVKKFFHVGGEFTHNTGHNN